MRSVFYLAHLACLGCSPYIVVWRDEQELAFVTAGLGGLGRLHMRCRHFAQAARGLPLDWGDEAKQLVK